jgi:hypothetical protein
VRLQTTEEKLEAINQLVLALAMIGACPAMTLVLVFLPFVQTPVAWFVPGACFLVLIVGGCVLAVCTRQEPGLPSLGRVALLSFAFTGSLTVLAAFLAVVFVLTR